MIDANAPCGLCEPGVAERLDVAPLWEHAHWRAYVMRSGPSPGFCLLSLSRHALSFDQLQPEEAASLGPAIVQLTSQLIEVFSPERTYAYSFGDHIPHAHFGMAPHVVGDDLLGSAGVARAGTTDAETLAGAAARLVSAVAEPSPSIRQQTGEHT